MDDEAGVRPVAMTEMLTRRRDADLLERALSGDPHAHRHPALADGAGDLAVLVRLAEELPRPHVRPGPEFVARLRDQLVAEAQRGALPNALDDRTAEVAATTTTLTRSSATPRTVRVPRAARLMAGLATAVVLVAALLGGLSTRALPGDTLYPVKLMIGDAQVRLAGSDLGRGTALLGQVDERLDEVDALVAAGSPSSALVDQTLARASDDLGTAQRQLLTGDDGSADPRALQVLADAGAQTTGRLAALRDRVPLESVPAVDRLLQQLAQGQAAMVQQLDQLARAGGCTDLCGTIRTTLEHQGAQLTRLLGGGTGTPVDVATGLSGPASGQRPGTEGDGTDDGTAASGTARSPGGGLPTSAPGMTVPGVSVPGVTVPGATVHGGSGGGVTASVPGATVSVPGASVSVPSVGVTVPDPSSPGLPGITAGGTTPTLGPVTVPVPPVEVGGDCTLGLGSLCLGG